MFLELEHVCRKVVPGVRYVTNTAAILGVKLK